MNKLFYFIGITLLASIVLTSCGKEPELKDYENATKALHEYAATLGDEVDVCFIESRTNREKEEKSRLDEDAIYDQKTRIADLGTCLGIGKKSIDTILEDPSSVDKEIDLLRERERQRKEYEESLVSTDELTAYCKDSLILSDPCLHIFDLTLVGKVITKLKVTEYLSGGPLILHTHEESSYKIKKEFPSITKKQFDQLKKEFNSCRKEDSLYVCAQFDSINKEFQDIVILNNNLNKESCHDLVAQIKFALVDSVQEKRSAIPKMKEKMKEICSCHGLEVKNCSKQLKKDRITYLTNEVFNLIQSNDIEYKY